LEETCILLLRHAETSAPDVFHGAESDIGLSEWGKRQAVLLAESLKLKGAKALYCSGMRRAVETARPIGEACRLAPIVVESLHERRIGPLSGLSRDDGWSIYAESKKRWLAGDLEFTHPGGESFADIRRRVLPVFDDLRARHSGESIIVVAHGMVIRVVLACLLECFQPADFDRIAIDFASINDLRWEGNRWRAQTLNQVLAPSPVRPVA
jgi:2,3-bisphosphoglycerate-dependent phosphoglycerate mutase